MKEVIVINYTGRSGGGPIDAIEMAKGFVANGENVVAIISNKVSNLTEWLSFGFDQVVQIDTFENVKDLIQKELSFKRNEERKIKKALDGCFIKFVYCPMMSLWTRKINNVFNNIPVYVVNHDPIPHSGDKGTRLLNIFGMQKVFHNAKLIVTHSNQFVDYINMKYSKNGNVLYVPLGIQNVGSTGKQKIKYDAKKINFLFFGRIEEYKGVDVLIKAYSKLREKYNNITLNIVGSGNVNKYAALYTGIENVTIVNEWIPDSEVGDYFLGENIVLVLPYRDATQSGPVLIGYQYGIPAIVSNTGGLGKQVVDGKTGFLVEPESVESLFRAMEKIVLDNSKNKVFDYEIKKYLEKISWESSARKIIEWNIK